MADRPVRRIELSLYTGPGVPTPADRAVVEAVTQVTVQSSSTGQSGFELTFSLGKDRAVEQAFLPARPVTRVVVAVTINGTPEVLIDGVMTDYRITPGNASGPATLSVMGKDLTALMALVAPRGLPYPALALEAQVALILTKYAFLGVAPSIVPSVFIDLPNPLEEYMSHQGSDYDYLNYLSELVGYVFYHEPGLTPGQSFAYWGPEIKVGEVQPPLNVDMDALTNVQSLNFRFDDERNRLPVVLLHDAKTRALIPVPVPDVTPLNPPLGAVPPLPKGLEFIPGSAKLSWTRALLVGLAQASKNAEAVGASGSLDVVRYGRPLKPRRLVGVRGAGESFDGLYYVRSVSHNIRHGSYTQSFELSRNGLVSTVPKVSF